MNQPKRKQKKDSTFFNWKQYTVGRTTSKKVAPFSISVQPENFLAMDLQSLEAANQTNFTEIATHSTFQRMDVWDRILYMGLLTEKYYTPILCVVGVLGNFLSLLVFLLDTKYRRLSSSYYLSALAVSDTGFLFSLFVVWLETIVGDIITSAIVCPLIMYIGQVTCFVTMYLIVAFSFQRYLVVYYPLERVKYCTKNKAKITICGIIVLALVTFSYFWVIAEVVTIELSTGYIDVCSVSERYYEISKIAIYIDSTITLIIPFFIIAYFNLKTAIKVCELGKQRRLITAASLMYNVANTTLRGSKIQKQQIVLWNIQHRARDCLQIIALPLVYVDIARVMTKPVKNVKKKITQPKFECTDAHVVKTLLLVSGVFLGLNMPLHVIRCIQFIQIARGSHVGAKILLGLQPWANMLFNTNFAVNMVLYCIFGKNFRNSVRNVFQRLTRK